MDRSSTAQLAREGVRSTGKSEAERAAAAPSASRLCSSSVQMLRRKGAFQRLRCHWWCDGFEVIEQKEDRGFNLDGAPSVIPRDDPAQSSRRLCSTRVAVEVPSFDLGANIMGESLLGSASLTVIVVIIACIISIESHKEDCHTSRKHFLL